MAIVHKIDAAGKTLLGAGVRLERIVIGEGLDIWVCEYRRTEGGRRAAVADRLEIGTSLSGQWAQDGFRSGGRIYGRGVLHALAPAEPYRVAYRADDTPSVVAGFTAAMPVLVGDADADRDLEVAGAAATRDAELQDLLGTIYATRRAGRPLPLAEIAAALMAYVRRHGVLSERSTLARVRFELERFAERQLYLEHLAGDAGMTSATFLRAFRRRYGITPVHYRTRVRLNAAARTAWSCPELSVREIAERHGFENLSYFHRLFRAYYGTTPDRHRQNGLSLAAPHLEVAGPVTPRTS